MGEKRFTLDDEENGLCRCILVDGEEMPTCEICDLLNELSEEKEYFERKKEYFLSKWSIVNAKNIQLRQEIDDLKEENEKLRFLIDINSVSERKKLERQVDEQQATINLLLDLLYQSEATVINEYSSHIGEDMDKLDKIFKEKDIKEIERFVRGCDDE